MWTFELIALPDAADSTLRMKTDGDISAAAQADSAHLARTVAELPPGSVTLAFRYIFEPKAGHRHPQQRLSIQVVGRAHDTNVAPALSVLLERDPLHRIFPLEPVAAPDIDWGQYKAACDVARRQSILPATITPELNPAALPQYLQIGRFEPSNNGNELMIDRILDRLEEPVLIEVAVEPVDVTAQLVAHTRYVAQLQAINRTWETDNEDTDGAPWSHGEWAPWVASLKQRDPLAEDVARTQQRFHETFTCRHLKFHVRVLAASSAVARVIAATVAETAFAGGSYQLFDSAAGDDFFASAVRNMQELRVTSAPALRRLLGAEPSGVFVPMAELGNLTPVEEFTTMFRLPLGSRGSPRCIRKHTDPPTRDPAEIFVLDCDAQFIELTSSSPTQGVLHGIALNVLTKHAALFGMTGYGKTIASFNILRQLNERGIPYCVLEAGTKREYRLLKCLREHADPQARSLAAKLQVYTPGSSVSPLRLNPLHVVEGISRYPHIENLLACFKAAMPMEGSMLGILAEGLEEVYASPKNDGSIPRMQDVYRAVRKVLAAKGYSSEVDSNFKALFDVRLGALTRRAMGEVFQSAESVPTIDQLLAGQSIIELASLPGEQACLFALFLLMAIWEKVQTTPWSGSGVRFVVLLEEAHNIVGVSTSSSASEENADPRAHASELICRMLAELRALGVAIVILDQMPSAVAPQVIKNTASKLLFRVPDPADREVIGGAMLFGPEELEEIARSSPGDAYFHTEGYFGPRRIRATNLQAAWNLPLPPFGEAILPYLRDDPWFIEAANARVAAELGQLRRAMDKFDSACDAAFVRASAWLEEHPTLLADPQAPRCRVRLEALECSARALRSELGARLSSFKRDIYAPLLGQDSELHAVGPDLIALRDQLRDRFERTVGPATEACLQVLDRLAGESGEIASFFDGE